MFVVAISIILILIGVVALIGAQRTRNPRDRASLTGGGATALGLAVVVVILGMVTTVGANKVGVVTSVGRYQGVINPGLHFLAPWTDVEEFGTRIQPLELTGTPVRFDLNSGGTADLLVEWRIEATDEPAVRRLWSDYRTFEAVENRLVRLNAITSLNVVLSGYTPGDGIGGSKRQAITDATLAGIQNRLKGTGVVVERVTIPQINPDGQSQERINRQTQARADLERTEITQQIAGREAEIAAIRQRSQTPSSLQYECLRIASDWNQATQGPLPTTWNCALGAAAPPVIVGR